MMNGIATQTLRAVELAKLVRPQLKAAFPGVKFSVCSEQRELVIRYADGPDTAAVRAIAAQYGCQGGVDAADCPEFERNAKLVMTAAGPVLRDYLGLIYIRREVSTPIEHIVETCY